MSKDTAAAKNIVILGAGFGGIACAKELLRKLPEGRRVVLIDKNHFQVFHPALYEVATAAMDKEPLLKFDFQEIISNASFELKEIFPKEENIKIINGEIKDLFLNDRKVIMSDGQIAPFDYLVVALGSETNFFGIPGLKEKALELKNVYDAVNIRNAICEVFARKQPQQRISIVVGGGGFTGCEFAAELGHAIEKLCVQYPHWRERVSITVVEASSSLLPGAKIWIQDEMRRTLEDLGITIYFNHPIEKVDDNYVILKNGERLFFDVLLWTAGVKGNSLMEKISGVKIEKGCRILTNNFLQVIPYKNVFAAGDNIHCFDPKIMKPVPATAQGAMAQGRIAAKNIARAIQKEKLKEYRFRRPIFVVPTGGKSALSDFYGLKLRGIAGWLLHQIAFLRYFMSILPFSKAFRLWRSQMKIFSKND